MSLRQAARRDAKIAIREAILVALAFVVFVAASTTSRADESASKTVCVLIIHEDISRNTVYLIRRGLRDAEEKKVAAVVLDMQTNGGRVDATEEIIRLLEGAPMKTYTFVNDKAYSAGAYIAAATDKIFMAPGSVIGAATPVMIGETGVQELPKSYEEKLTSAMTARIRATAQEKGYNPDVFEAMVDADRGLTIDGKVITPKGKLLTLTNEDAARKYGNPPKPLLSSGTVKSVAELLDKVGLKDASTFEISPYGFEQLARWITTISPLLILVGFLALYIELSHPGMAVPAIVAVICFAIYFLGYFVAGFAGWEEIALFVFGLVLLAVEFFLFPGHFVSAALGTIAVLAALVLAMTGRLPSEPIIPTWSQVQLPLAKVFGAMLGSMIAAALLARWLPKSTLFKKMELAAATSSSQGYSTSLGEARALLGSAGVAETNLRPSGKGRFGDQLVDVVTEGDLIERGQPIKIIEVQGSRVVVKRAA
ncbi:MAG TPA: NfeD family protein [Verrucomicrobiae bacterium]|nr:NfeD family protein [Verrucomicrobiae bacterium]